MRILDGGIIAYDAMTSDRPYQRSIAPREALIELRRNAGTQFDPIVVDAFAAVLAASRPSLHAA